MNHSFFILERRLMKAYLLPIFILSLLLFVACKKRLVDDRTGTDFQLKSSLGEQQTRFPFHFVTDLEGKKEGLLNNLDKKGMELREGRLHFTDPKAELFIGGDLSDRGSDSIKIRRMLADLKTRHPGRVHIIWGNRELNKLGMLYVMPLLEKMGTHSYMAGGAGSDPKTQLELFDLLSKYGNWLMQQGIYVEPGKDPQKALEKANTPERRLDWFFEQIGCNNCLDYHQQELTELSGREVSRREAAEDYLKSLDPKKGEFYKFLEMGQFMVTKERNLMVHGQVNMENFGLVPGNNQREARVEDWVNGLNGWGRAKLKQIKMGYEKKTSASLQAIKELAQYSDTVWDYGLGKGFANETSVVYAYRQKEGNNFRLPEYDTINTLRSQGYSTLIVGHSPAGNVPIPLKADDFMQIMGDTSYGKDRAGTVSFNEKGEVKMTGTTNEGHYITTRVSPFKDGPVGKTYKGATVIGEIGKDVLLTFKYNADYSFEEIPIHRSEVNPQELKIPYYNYNHTKLAQRGELIQVLADKEIPIWTLQELTEAAKKRRVIYLSTESTHGNIGRQERATAVNEAKALIDGLSSSKYTIMTNGSNQGIEAEINQYARSKGFEVVAALAETAVPQNISEHIRAATIIAEGSQDKGLNLINHLKKINGKAVFIGGGPQVAEQIDLSLKLFSEHFD